VLTAGLQENVRQRATDQNAPTDSDQNQVGRRLGAGRDTGSNPMILSLANTWEKTFSADIPAADVIE